MAFLEGNTDFLMIDLTIEGVSLTILKLHLVI